MNSVDHRRHPIGWYDPIAAPTYDHWKSATIFHSIISYSFQAILL